MPKDEAQKLRSIAGLYENSDELNKQQEDAHAWISTRIKEEKPLDQYEAFEVPTNTWFIITGFVL
jgi:hypothetical protein